MGMTWTLSSRRPAAPVLVMTPRQAGSPCWLVSTLAANRSSDDAASSTSRGLSLISKAAHSFPRSETIASISLPLASPRIHLPAKRSRIDPQITHHQRFEVKPQREWLLSQFSGTDVQRRGAERRVDEVTHRRYPQSAAGAHVRTPGGRVLGDVESRQRVEVTADRLVNGPPTVRRRSWGGKPPRREVSRLPNLKPVKCLHLNRGNA